MTNSKKWTNSSWEQSAKNSFKFDCFKVYIIECTDSIGFEKFLKIGKTYTTIEERFKTFPLDPYTYKVNTVFRFDGENAAEKCSSMEKYLHAKFKNKKYYPLFDFNGCKECFDITIKEEL